MARGSYGRGGGPAVYPGLPPSARSGSGSARAQVALLEERIRTILDGLGGSYNVEIAIPNTVRDPPRLVRGGYSKAKQATLSEVAGWFLHGTTKMPSRNMLVLTPGSRQEIFDAVTQRFYEGARSGTVPTLGQLMPAIAYRWRDIVVRRWAAGGGDLTLHELTTKYRARKLRLGYPARIGTLTGQTIQAIRKAQPVIRRVR